MQNLLGLFIILFASLENVWPMFVGYAAAPKGVVFLGTIHHPGDYFYYLSQFAQGATRWFTAQDLYTSESVTPNLVGWSNVLLGRIFHLVGLPPIAAYLFSVALFTILLLLVVYIFATKILESRARGILALYLFALYHAFPIRDMGALTYSDYWNNYAVPSVRMGSVPHQLLTAITSLLIATWTITWTRNSIHGTKGKKHQKTAYAALFVAGTVLASLQPILWGVLLGSIGLAVLIYGLLQKYKIKQLSTLFIPSFFIGIGGLIPTLYLTRLFTTQPYIQLKLWESAQRNQLTFSHFFLAAGPIFLIAILSIPTYLASRSFPKLFTLLFALCSLLFFLSPIPALLGVTHVRFMSTLAIVCISTIAAYGLSKLRPRGFSIGILILITLILLPNHLNTIRLASTFDLYNAYQYLSVSDYRFLALAANRSHSDQDTYLIIWPYNSIFPGLTGKRSFHGHNLLTINSKVKDALAQRFFEGSMTEDEMQRLLSENDITYVLGYSWSPKLGTLTTLTAVASTPTLTLYQVVK